MIILIGGPDGCGKSTVAELLSRHLVESGMKVQRMHYRPNIVFSKQVTQPDSGSLNSDPHSLEPHNLLRSLAKLAATFVDTIAFYIPGRPPRPDDVVVIQERGWWDQAIDTERYRLHPLTQFVVRTLGALLPRPALVVVLTGPAMLIHSRKPELSVIEISRQTDAWVKTAPRIGKKYINVDIRESPEMAAQKILRILETE